MSSQTAVQATIERKLRDSLSPEELRIENESHKHGGPATESHFKLTVVAAEFEGVRAVKRHQRLYSLLADELKQGVHALALHLYAPSEWENSPQAAPSSPNCLGGSKG